MPKVFKWVRSRTFIGLSCFLLGISTVLLFQRFYLKGNVEKGPATRKELMDMVFSQVQLPVEKAERDEILKHLELEEDVGLFDSWSGMGEATGTGEMKKREDQQFVYYEVAVKGLKQEKINVEVQDHQLNVSGQIEEETQGDHSKSYVSSSFHRSFPVPAHVDPSSVQTEYRGGKLIIKFRKA